MADNEVFDGRVNFPVDNDIEQRLDAHFEKFGINNREIWRNFQIYTRRVFLKKFLAHYEFFQMVKDLPGDIVELGVFRGASLFSWANFMEIRNMGDRHKRVIGFDNFAGFGEMDAKDGAAKPDQHKAEGGFSSAGFYEQLKDAIAIYDADRFIPYKARIVLVEGDIEESVPRWVTENPGHRISLLHCDVDLYRPTKVALEQLWPLVVPGGVVLFDEYGIPPWEGESRAVDEFFADKGVKLRRLDWSSNPGAYVIKP